VPAGAEPVAPSVVHFTIGHYVLLVRTDGRRYLIRDPGLGGETWITREAFQREASGYALVPQGRRPATWAAVTPEEAAGVVGDSTCPPGPPTTNDPPSCSGSASSGSGSGGLDPIP
jgi:hypothetical protein